MFTICGCGSGTAPSASPPSALQITTTSLPNGTVGASYSATLDASGGAAPYTWSLTGGTLPSGVTLNGSTGAITGTPAASVSDVALAFKVTDSGKPAQLATANLLLTISSAALAITTTSLPNGSVGSSYSASLVASGGTAPLTWSLTRGTLPSGLALETSTGTITGTPTATATATALTFQVRDSSNPSQEGVVSLTLNITVAPADISIAISPARAALVAGQTLPLTATTNDSAGVTWSVSPSGGSFSSPTSASGASVEFTAAAAAGVYTVTAASVTSAAKSSSVTIGVTDLPGVYTYHNDPARDGLNGQEYALTTSSVNTGSFGKLFSCAADGAIYAQPLWVANLNVNGTTGNVVFVATAHDGLFAFNADSSPCVMLWSANLIDAAHGGNAGEATVPASTTDYLVGDGEGSIAPEVGVIGTPVIDPATRTLYVVSKSVDSGRTTFYERLHAIDPTSGHEKPGSPIMIGATYPGSGDGGARVTFDPQKENQRAGLALVNGTVYIAWASYADVGRYYGWLIGYSYNGSSFTQSSVLNVAPNVGSGGIWMSGAAPAADSGGNLYIITGNAEFDAASPTTPNNDYGDSFLKLSNTLAVLQYFTPTDESLDSANDDDFGAGGATVLADLPPGGPVTHLAIGGGKDGSLFVLNRDSMGGFGDSNALQRIDSGGNIFSTGALWNQTFYVVPVWRWLQAYRVDPSTGKLTLTGSSARPSVSFGYYPGATPSVSAAGTTNGIVWALDTSQYCIPNQNGPGLAACGPAVLHAYDATNVGNELWNSAMRPADAAGNAVKFAVPTVANGKVYVGTRGNNTGGVYGSTSISGELDVYGLKPN